jgi:pimeloyl-ACP methyl ester carboxylesterase
MGDAGFESSAKRNGGPVQRISLIVVLAAVACGASAIWFRGGQTSKRVGENRTIRSRDGMIIGFTKQGSGPPLIIVDGSFCYRDNGPATELGSVLAQHFTVFTYDRRGRGQSGDTPPYSVQREIEDVQGIAMQAGAPPFAVGISSGHMGAFDNVSSSVGMWSDRTVDQ